MGAEFLVNSALFCIFLFFCARTSNFYVCSFEKINRFPFLDFLGIFCIREKAFHLIIFTPKRKNPRDSATLKQSINVFDASSERYQVKTGLTT